MPSRTSDNSGPPTRDAPKADAPNTDRLEHSHEPEAIALRLALGRNQNYLKDAVYGAIDGAVTTFAVVSGVAGAGLSPSIVIILGLANLVGDGFSMAAGNFLGTRADNQQLAKLHAIERNHIATCPEGEREEVRQILAKQGFDGELLDAAVEQITSDESTWIDTMLRHEYGVSVERPSALSAAIVTFLSFMVIGLIPLMPFLIQWISGTAGAPFQASAILTGTAFFIVGAIKSFFVDQRWWWSGAETFAVGSIAAALAYFVGYFLARL